ncbi:MAG TPA: dephospho-CoA kinase [Alphaproteobacteria bacterium]|nr:dephospho-CoA kinase [Alphaproteobacteria bacterium]
MIIIGLTGSIGMGKTTAGTMLKRLGVPVYDADAAVHRVFAHGGGAVEPVGRAFPGTVKDGAVDRDALGAAVLGDREKLARLEAIVHPQVRDVQRAFLRRAARTRRGMVVLDVPLLFETGGERRCDYTVLVSAPRDIQARRVLRRPGMTAEKFAAILARQMSDYEKRKRADFIVLTALDKGRTMAQLARIVATLRGREGYHWPPFPQARQHR